MKSVIKYEIYEIIENKGWDGGNTVTQKTAKMIVVNTQNRDDPNYVYGQVSGGSQQSLVTINPNVYNTWYVGAIVTCEMEVAPLRSAEEKV